jgi:cytochrome c-type biogenesis protein CcmE
MTTGTLAKIALTAAVAIAGVGFVVKSTLGNAQPHKQVDELGDDLARWQDGPLTVYGTVVAGSIREAVVGQETRRSFVVENGGKRIRVFHTGPKPDVFKDRSEVGVTGRLVAADDERELASVLGVAASAEAPYVVTSTSLMAKCPGHYTGALVNKDLDTPFQ